MYVISWLFTTKYKKNRQYTFNVTLRRIRVTVVAVNVGRVMPSITQLKKFSNRCYY